MGVESTGAWWGHPPDARPWGRTTPKIQPATEDVGDAALLDPREITAATAALGVGTQGDHGIDQTNDTGVGVFASTELVDGLDNPTLEDVDVGRMMEVPGHNWFERHSFNELTDPSGRNGPGLPVRVRVGIQRRNSPSG